MSRFAIAPEFKERVRRDEPMSRHTSWHVGGPADAWFTPRDVEDLSAFLRALPAEVPVTWVGLGSNLLVRDGGIRGAVISVHGVFNALERVGSDSVRAEAGVPCARLGRQCAKWLIGPADFFAGIPGTVGGALAMNAGAWGGETWPCVVEAETIDRRDTVIGESSDMLRCYEMWHFPSSRPDMQEDATYGIGDGDPGHDGRRLLFIKQHPRMLARRPCRRSRRR